MVPALAATKASTTPDPMPTSRTNGGIEDAFSKRCCRYAVSEAEETTDAGASRPFKPAPAALLPPIPLYRRLLRSHRKRLGVEERLLGDMYVKAEFRAHRDVENPVQIIGFLSEWQTYCQMLEGDSWKEAKMDKAKIDKMSDQQIGQLYELMQQIKTQAQEDADAEEARVVDLLDKKPSKEE
ncbi:acetate non-utilizing 9 mitochondrial [Pyrenophora seminiperda CCB06]|uniref:Succinate dehydrogenase assembly factor 3 n=1 Tax=Pyrenophora seminiperda CCB06 TaxID=1302712 RepID=A0A3M7M6U9_9PLEO|nr:acetate non-utilizing 9 mitochondrial [Pyrenophora seminiperda CCB06]